MRRESTPSEAISTIRTGTSVLAGFLSARIGAAESLIAALLEAPVRDLHLVILALSNEADPFVEMAARGIIRKLTIGFNNSNRRIQKLSADGLVELDWVPYGTLVERVRAGGAGIPAFFTPVGAGTSVESGKPVAEFDGRPCVLERAIRCDFALIRAEVADRFGNLSYSKFHRQLNHLAALAAGETLVEVSRMTECLDPSAVDTPGAFVDHVVVSRNGSTRDGG